MIRGLFTSVSGMIVQERKQNAAINNIANATTTGYKRDAVVASTFREVMIRNHANSVNGKNVATNLGTLALGSSVNEVYTDFSGTSLQSTDFDTDFGLQGEGFFSVERNGQEVYTRNGHFNRDMQGYLVNDAGDYLLGSNNERIFVGNNEFSVSSNGRVTVANGDTYDLKIVDFENYDDLVKVGENVYTGNNAFPAAGYSVTQRALEGSNVNVTNEMVDMMTISRQFETSQKIIQTIDDTLDKAVNQVGALR